MVRTKTCTLWTRQGVYYFGWDGHFVRVRVVFVGGGLKRCIALDDCQ